MSDEQVAAARQSLAVAIRAQKEGDEEKAKRFVEKSLRLHPTAEAKKLQRQLNGETVDENAAPPQPAASEDTTRGTGAAGGSRRSTETHRQEPKKHHGHQNGHAHPRGVSVDPGAASEGSGPPATPDQIELVNRIRKTTCYYQMLSVTKQATEDDIKKAYRKIALKLHPDKNRAPGAEEAFKSVSKAFHCLSNNDLRSNYDRFGSERPNGPGASANGMRPRQAGQPGPFYYGGGGAEDDFDPDFIFRTFFGGDPFFAAAFGGPQMQMHLRRRDMAQQQQQQRRRREQARARANDDSDDEASERPPINMGNLLLRIAPFLFLLLNAPLMSLFFGESTPTYQFERTRAYPYEQVSTRFQVPYYLQDLESYGASYPIRSSKRQKFELQVEQQYFNQLQEKCAREHTNYAAYRRWSMHPPEDWRAVACEELKSRFRHDMGYRFEYYTKPAVAEGAGVGGDAKAKSS